MDLVFLHGTAASGKLTTAQALEDRLGYPVFHNHLVVDLLTTVFPFGSELFVRLGVSEAEQEKRIGAASRHSFSKLTDLSTLRSLRNYREGVEQPPVDLHVDADTSAPERTAEAIIERFRLTPQQRGDRYPAPS